MHIQFNISMQISDLQQKIESWTKALKTTAKAEKIALKRGLKCNYLFSDTKRVRRIRVRRTARIFRKKIYLDYLDL